MSENQFLISDQAPDEAAIKAVLGEKFVWYEAICDAGDDFEQEWKFHGKKYGWKLKVHDYVKTLFELTIADGAFKVGMAIRDSEIKALQADPVLSAQLGDLLSSEKFAEGWGIKLSIDSAEICQQAVLLLRAVAEMRGVE